MSKVLVLGATGYIGQALCCSLLRSGDYIVYGLARTEEKARSLAALEIIPVQGSVENSATYMAAIREENIDVIIDASAANQKGSAILEDVNKVGVERITDTKSNGVQKAKLGFIYISGAWVHGSSTEPVNDLSPVGNQLSPHQPPDLVAWRPTLEQQVLASANVLNVGIIRPALLYGTTSAIWSTPYFSKIMTAVTSNTAKVTLEADQNSMPGLIHLDDAVSGIHALVDRLEVISGTGVYPVFDLQTSQERMGDILERASKAMGFQGEVEFAGPGQDLFAMAMNTSLNINSGRARTILGWAPKRFGMLSRIETYVKAWVAAQKLESARL